jgi:hypothetical protein
MRHGDTRYADMRRRAVMPVYACSLSLLRALSLAPARALARSCALFLSPALSLSCAFSLLPARALSLLRVLSLLLSPSLHPSLPPSPSRPPSLPLSLSLSRARAHARFLPDTPMPSSSAHGTRHDNVARLDDVCLDAQDTQSRRHIGRRHTQGRDASTKTMQTLTHSNTNVRPHPQDAP